MNPVPKQARWIRSLLEVGTIVGSILLAFSINAWWDGHKERVRSKEVAAELHSDFASTGRLLRVALGYAEAVSGRSEGFLRATTNGKGITDDSIRVLGAALSEEISFAPAIAHYKAAVSSGEIRLLKSDSLMVYLNRFDEGLHRFEQHNEISAQLFYWGAIHDLRKEFGGISGLLSQENADLAQRIQRAPVRASAETMAILQINVVQALKEMLDATTLILTELEHSES
jgi:hypothetical protein